jgi:hypothetical protein
MPVNTIPLHINKVFKVLNDVLLFKLGKKVTNNDNIRHVKEKTA